jgi:drug/metabolite transporter (DMT)-like permease
VAIADLGRLLVLAALWGGSFTFIRVAVPALGPLWLAESRVSIAFAALFAFGLFRGGVPSLRAHWRGFLAVGVINSALPFALFCYAEQYVTASTAAVLNATSPFFGAMVAAAWLKEPLAPVKIAGMAIGLAGVAVLVGWHPEPLAPGAMLAMAACMAAALCYGVASVYAKARLTSVPSFSIALYSQLGAALALAPSLPLSPPAGSPSVLVVANVLALALASTAVAYMLYFRLIANIGPARALSVTFLIPLFGVFWGVVFLGETLAANTLAGCALILGGTWLAVRTKLPPSPAGRVAERQTSSAAGPSICSRSSR